MKMNHFVVPAVLMLGMTAACVESTPSLQIEGAAPQNADCTLPDTDSVKLLRGSVNVGLTAGYPLVFGITSNLVSTPIEVGDQPVGGDADLDTIYITEQELSYATSPRVDVTQPDGPIPLYGTLSVDGQILLNLLTADAASDLQERVGGADQPASVLLSVTVKLRGKRVSGDEVESNEVTYPIIVTDTPAPCPAGTVEVPSSDACPQVGLNGAGRVCEAPDTTP